MRRLSLIPNSEFWRFSVVGAIGFLIDAGVLYICIYILNYGPYYGRVVSFVIAATTTWGLNRYFTFPQANRLQPYRQWAVFIGANSLGAIVNYTIYALIMSLEIQHYMMPLIAVATGSVSGLVLNYSSSKLLVFKK